MEEEKAAAYYDELTRKGEGAARFKQGLGFSSTTATTNDAVPARGSALPSFLSSFVRASSPSKPSEYEKEAQLVTIQNKLKKKPNPAEIINHHNQSSSSSSRDRVRDRDRHSSRRNRSRSPSRDDHRSRRHRSSSRDRDRERDRDSSRQKESQKDRDRERRKRRRSRSRSVSDGDKGRRRGRERSRSLSPPNRRSEMGRSDDRRSEKVKSDGGTVGKGKNSAIDYAKLIEGYEKMTPAERVKAKMKLQLSETAKKDATNGMGSGWERFDFDKDAPLDDEEIEAAEDDGELVKHIGQSFRFNAVKARREDEIKAAHDEAMFGVSSVPPSVDTDSEVEGHDNYKLPSTESAPVTNLISNQVLAMQKGSWRDRVGKK